ncbi:MAG: hypothetical protein M3Y32_01940 [Pseudomonadota bacterium]|nr:hypothetical protein [Pseudomonadota bacterium]
MSEDKAEAVSFNPLGQYALPAMPAVHALKRFATMLRKRIQQDADDPVLANDRLQRASSDEIDSIVAPPAHGSLLTELDRSLNAWCEEASPPVWLKVVVLPPGDRQPLLQSWAEAHGYPLLQPPQRARLLDPPTIDAEALQGSGVLVIPDLAGWFLRHRNGLQSVRSLLLLLSRAQRHCVLGCNSWAWAFLCRAAGADLLLPPAITFRAFDAMRLRAWFDSLAAATAQREAVTFRLAGSGVDVLAQDSSGELDNAYLKRLAARSFGIPWVAWHLWRLGLRSRLEGNGLSDKALKRIEHTTAGDERTVWVVGFDELVLPKKHADEALLVLQALLIHGTLDASSLRAVLPHLGEAELLPALIRAGFVLRTELDYHVLPSAYPQAREALAAAGYPLDHL